ncbi:hypothetical protein M438DRAFT_210012 [Aureobasidium pullulans EXF-150]|uniref:Uncharacterized protein n=1 Tax=Aureobasidium pullulans EXF-150 TaxID=1043002 RepID=A0A074YBN0_AURPU|nr:uncharacterized protein M438DRAFT_210012 [Aureobasidium pullulans EXF-150]KEQ84261.1 hypothetical protein M438DRAFT_210012 [Aureobasidium pullulans EXF-150]
MRLQAFCSAGAGIQVRRPRYDLNTETWSRHNLFNTRIQHAPHSINLLHNCLRAEVRPRQSHRTQEPKTTPRSKGSNDGACLALPQLVTFSRETFFSDIVTMHASFALALTSQPLLSSVTRHLAHRFTPRFCTPCDFLHLPDRHFETCAGLM